MRSEERGVRSEERGVKSEVSRVRSEDFPAKRGPGSRTCAAHGLDSLFPPDERVRPRPV